ncbi:MarR family transcriptional regulator [Natronobacterium gregoryi]|uniref:HTH marR-type domain-containing protein n=2 Tax=Natronobacterium gregoryi TaxID=44930 RepID=L0AMI0_NATGS|nr:hypothetical protein Natgr_3531 [Natronobacterium gregoryi SP2]SFJ31275.1 MarR family protein [Natronobacterium gregoryi]
MVKRDEAWHTALYLLNTEGSITSTEIARNTSVSVHTANDVLRYMERQGYVQRETQLHETFHVNEEHYIFE